jgi:hypothetical protein
LSEKNEELKNDASESEIDEEIIPKHKIRGFFAVITTFFSQFLFFRRKINMNPDLVRGMSPEQKGECMDEVNKIRNAASKYSIWYTVGALTILCAGGIINITGVMKGNRPITEFIWILILTPALILLPAIIAHVRMAKNFAATVVMVDYLLFALFYGFRFYQTKSLIFCVFIIFSLVGTVLYFNMFPSKEIYAALEKEDGFPDFFEIKDEKNDGVESAGERQIKREFNLKNDN